MLRWIIQAIKEHRELKALQKAEAVYDDYPEVGNDYPPEPARIGKRPIKYRKKPVVIEAFRLAYADEPEWFKGKYEMYRQDGKWLYDFIVIRTLEGNMRAYPGDWIIKGVKGELYPCRDDIFQATYEKVE